MVDGRWKVNFMFMAHSKNTKNIENKSLEVVGLGWGNYNNFINGRW